MMRKPILLLLIAVLTLNTLSGCFLFFPRDRVEDSSSSQASDWTASVEDNDPSEDYIPKIYGEWVTEQGTLLVFQPHFHGYYKSADDRQDNYYTGSRIEILWGDEALYDLGIDEEEASRVEIYRDSSTVYSVRAYVWEFRQDGDNRTDEVPEDGHHQFMFKLLSEDEAIAVVVDTGTILELTRIAGAVDSAGDPENYRHEIYGEWMSTDGALLVLSPDMYAYYPNAGNWEDNYFVGTRIDVLKGPEAVYDLGFNSEEISLVDDIDVIYSIRGYVDVHHQNGVDRSGEIPDNACDHILFKLMGENSAGAVFMHEDIQLTLIKVS